MNGQPKKNIWISAVFGILGLGALIWYITLHSEELTRLRGLSIRGLCSLSLLALVTIGLSSLRLRLMLTVFNAHISSLESFSLNAAGGLINYLPLNTAQVFRAVYLKKVRGLKYTNFGLGSSVIVLANFVASGTLGLLALYILTVNGFVLPTFLFQLFFLFSIGPFALVVLCRIFRRSRWGDVEAVRAKKQTWFTRIYLSLLGGLDLIAGKPRVTVTLFLIEILVSIVKALRLLIVGILLGYPIGFFSGLVLQGTSSVTSLFTMLPLGAIGLREAIIGATVKAMNGQIISGVMMAAVDRVIVMFWVTLCGSAGFIFLAFQKSGNNDQDNNHS